MSLIKEFNGYGRQVVRDEKTGRVFLIEPITESVNTSGGWGDVDPVTKKTTGNY